MIGEIAVLPLCLGLPGPALLFTALNAGVLTVRIGALPADQFGIATWLGFAAMCTGMFLAIPDVQIVATSLPNIQDAFFITPDQMNWVQTAYLIAGIIGFPLTALLMRMRTIRWLFAAATAIFPLASVGCALSETFSGLIAWRVVQGLAGGPLTPLVFAAVFLLFPLRRQRIATTLAGMRRRFWPPPSARSSVAGSPRPIPGIGCS